MLFVQHALVHGIIPSLFLVEFSVSFRRFFVKRRVVEFCRRLRPGGEILYNGGEKGEKSMNGPMNLLVTLNEAYVPHLNVMLTSLFWKRTNRCGALAGMIVGGAMVFVWKFLVRPMGGLLDIYELLPAFLCALAAIFLVSLVTAKPDEAVVKEFEAVRRA